MSNPGVVDFYEVFMETLYKASGCRASVWGISHAGHAILPKEHSSNTETYSLEDQIDHKAAFIQDFVPPDKRIVLIGHSIGCHIILQIMQRHPTLPILKSLLLFPTIEKMWASPNGTVMAPFLCYARWLGVFVVFLGSYLSDWVKWRMVTWFLKERKVPTCAFHAALNLFNPSCANNSLTMAAHEMREVVEPDLDAVAKHLPKLVFYYGATDGWCPVDYHDDMKALFPEGDIRLCKRGMEHAFCLESSELMADMVWNWLHPVIKSSKS
ncbi:lipid droplet-associated hydrolase-like isoform X2 [Patiria miniata]|uniref:Lipid droplet-associated hydrolase n=1 Tax=Patiria miniata TaxID=46514 RepID=A0A913ZLB8_PATMI|nr:lipid droplet-associated hydrolase-like isoform X2 [Patiria miniata]